MHGPCQCNATVTGWDLRVAAELKTTEPITGNELRILREELDPTGIYLKGGG